MWDLIVSVPDHCLSFYFTSISDSLSNVCGYVLALAVRFLGIGYLLIDDGIH